MFNNIEKTAKTLAPILKAFVEKAIQPLLARIEALENRQPMPGEKGEQGEKGEPGKDGKDGESVTLEQVSELIKAINQEHFNSWSLEFERRAQDQLQKAIDKIPTPKDGKDGRDGKNGRDGLDLDLLQFNLFGRELALNYSDGQKMLSSKVLLELPIYKGVYKHGETYTKGDFVTYGGSLWHCNEKTDSKPSQDKAWQLAVKKGRDGKNFEGSN